MEVFQGNTWHSGDGGFIAKFSDGTVTDSTWKAQSFYIAPLQHPDDVVEYGNIHDTSHLGGRIHPLAKLPTCREHCFAIHYPIPDGWMNPILTCPFRKSYPDVVVMQPGQDWDGDDGTSPLDRPTEGRILVQRQVRANLVVIRPIRRKNLSQVCLAKDQLVR